MTPQYGCNEGQENFQSTKSAYNLPMLGQQDTISITWILNVSIHFYR